jgi:hypothetical protein
MQSHCRLGAPATPRCTQQTLPGSATGQPAWSVPGARARPVDPGALLPAAAGLLFLTTYTLLVLFWAEIYHQARSMPTGSLRPLFIGFNVLVYLMQVGGARALTGQQRAKPRATAGGACPMTRRRRMCQLRRAARLTPSPLCAPSPPPPQNTRPACGHTSPTAPRTPRTP